MSTAVPGTPAKRPLDREDALVLTILPIAALFWGLFVNQRWSLTLYNRIEIFVILAITVAAGWNYCRFTKAIPHGILSVDRRKRYTDAMKLHALLAILSLFLCTLAVASHQVEAAVPLLLAFVYATFIRSNRYTLKMIANEKDNMCAAKVNGAKFRECAMHAANNIYFIREENTPGFWAYWVLTVICCLVLQSIWPISPVYANQIGAIAAGAAAFHLAISMFRFARILWRTDDVVETLVSLGVHNPSDKKDKDRLAKACDEAARELARPGQQTPVIAFGLILVAVLGAVVIPQSLWGAGL